MHEPRSEVLFLHLQSIDNSRPRGFPVNLRAYQPYIIFPVSHCATYTLHHSIPSRKWNLHYATGIYDSLPRSALFDSVPFSPLPPPIRHFSFRFYPFCLAWNYFETRRLFKTIELKRVTPLIVYIYRSCEEFSFFFFFLL